MNHKYEVLWPLERCTLYTLCTLILSNSLHLTIRSSLNLIQYELWVLKCCHAHFFLKILMFRVSKKCHQDFNLLHTYYTYNTSFFWVKSGEKWFAHSVFSSLWPMHLIMITQTMFASMIYIPYLPIVFFYNEFLPCGDKRKG